MGVALHESALLDFAQVAVLHAADASIASLARRTRAEGGIGAGATIVAPRGIPRVVHTLARRLEPVRPPCGTRRLRLDGRRFCCRSGLSGLCGQLRKPLSTSECPLGLPLS